MRFREETLQLVELINATFRSSEKRDKYIQYVQNLCEKGLPPFLSFSHIADSFQIEVQSLYDLTFRTRYHYTTFEISKRSGGLRKISAPFSDLAEVQGWIRTNILMVAYPEFPAAVTGYVQNRSIIDHVGPHTDSECLIKFDVKDFFPSITSSQVTGIFISLGYSARVARTLAAIVTLEGSLPQGACTSPYLSNIRMMSFDQDVADFCRSLGFSYTRYADDIVVSGSSRLLIELESFYRFFQIHGLALNHKKTMVYRNPHQVRFITGLIIQNGTVRLPKAMRRQIRAECHSLIKALPKLQSGERDDSPNLQSNNFLKDPLAIEKLIGKLNYWLHIEPGHTYPMAVKQTVLSQI